MLVGGDDGGRLDRAAFTIVPTHLKLGRELGRKIFQALRSTPIDKPHLDIPIILLSYLQLPVRRSATLKSQRATEEEKK